MSSTWRERYKGIRLRGKRGQRTSSLDVGTIEYDVGRRSVDKLFYILGDACFHNILGALYIDFVMKFIRSLMEEDEELEQQKKG